MELADVRDLYLFVGLSDEQLGQLMECGHEVRFQAGDELFKEGAPALNWWVLIDGSLELSRRSEHEETVLGIYDRPGTWVGGFRAWAETGGYMATGRGSVPGRVLRVDAVDLKRLANQWFPFGVHLIEGIYQTVRNMDALSRQRQGLQALGTITAGLVHELNNPAAAAARAADGLQAAANGLIASLVGLAERSLSSEQFVKIEALRSEIDPSRKLTDALAIADREDEIVGWLDGHDVTDGWRIAPTLAEAGVDVEWCDRLAEILDPNTLDPAIEWVAGTLATRVLLADVSESTQRVSLILDAAKSYSQLDRASLQLIDVTEGIDSTLVVLRHQIGNGVTVERHDPEDLPQIEAMPGELNQVWTNLIVNAVDAMDGQGTLRISTRVDGDDVVVDVADTGAGMPPDVQAHAFDAFFTTKDVGKGTGLVLDISRRIVADRHRGDITIDSVPGRTVISVRLPRSHT